MDGASCEMKHLHKSLTAGFSDLGQDEQCQQPGGGEQIKKEKFKFQYDNPKM